MDSTVLDSITEKAAQDVERGLEHDMELASGLNSELGATLSSEFNQDELRAISMEHIEEKYALEDEMLAAISEGNAGAAMQALQKFQSFPNTRYMSDPKVSGLAGLLTLNTLCRKAVQGASVHPAHIDHVSAAFAERILATTSLDELFTIAPDMLNEYCQLVRLYSLKGYSALTQRALNYIDFNLTEELSLSQLAEKLNVSKKYLSTHFKKEVGETVTDYIHQKRVRESLKYLYNTNLAISDVALRVGIYDLNYYSRVFKNIMGVSPSQYRAALHE